jgi:hypothetical protein
MIIFILMAINVLINVAIHSDKNNLQKSQILNPNDIFNTD